MPDQTPQPGRSDAYSQADYEAACEVAFGERSVATGVEQLAERLKRIGEAIGLLHTRPDLPRGLADRVVRLGTLSPTWTPPGFAPASVSIAALTSVRSGDLLTQGYRGAEQGSRLIFTCDLGEIELDISPAQGGGLYMVRGQIDPIEADQHYRDGEVFVVGLGRPEEAARVAFDESGYFSLRLGAGVYDMTVVRAGLAARLPGIEIG